MKYRNRFISNSSSSNFLIFNRSREDKTVLDFLKECPDVPKAIKEINEDLAPFDEDVSIDDCEGTQWKIPARTVSSFYATNDEVNASYIFYHLEADGKSKNFVWGHESITI